MDYYGPAWGFGRAFELKLMREIAAFHDAYMPGRDLTLSAIENEALLGTVTMAGEGDKAHLRWFIVSDAARGRGVGRRLMRKALTFADEEAEATECYLTTFAGLDAARALYEDAGFTLRAEAAEDQWQGGVREQMWIRPRFGAD